jgi:hypothetical protein
MNRVAATMLAFGLVAGSPAVVACAPAAKLTAVEIAPRNLAARGGPDAWRKVETMVWAGHIESARAPVPSMPFKLEQKRPNSTRLEISAVGDKSVRVFNGVRGWKMSPGHGRQEAQPYDPRELKFAQAGHGIDGPLVDFAAKGSTVTLEGVDAVAGRQAYHLNVHLAAGGNEHVWVDTETYLELRYDRMAEGPAGSQRRVSVTYGDWRTVEGVRIPFLIATGGEPGTTPDKMKIETVLLNAPLAASTFENPAAARGRDRAWPSLASRAPASAAGEGGGSAPR